MEAERETKGEMGKRSTREEEEEENRTGSVLKEGVSFFFLLRPLTSLVKGKIWRVVVFLGVPVGES